MAQHNREKSASDSRLKITNQLLLFSAIERIRENTATSGHRHLLLIETSARDTESQAEVRCVIQQLYPDCLAVAGALTADLADRTDLISRYLGTERQAVVFDATARFDPGLLGAVASTVTAGGLMVLLTRPFDVWAASFMDNTPPGQTTTQPSTSPHHAERSRFIERFIRLFESAHDQPESMMTRLELAISRSAVPENCKEHNKEHKVEAISQSFATAVLPALPDTSWKSEQEELLKTLTSGLQTNEVQVFIVEAGRGRGKSSLLGRLAAGLDTRHISWQLTSPRRSAVDAFERHWRQQARHGAGLPPLKWVPTDQVPMHHKNPAENFVLFVDEAADIPLPQLMAWTRQYSTLILATTTTGYEGSGRGFVTRFYESLTQTATSWKRFTLRHPIRFGQNDPLEAFLNQVLLLDATAQAPHIDPSDLDVNHLRTVRLSQDELLEDEDRLGAIFGLLREAHYQTTPMDLVNLLDAQALRLYVITHGPTVLAVAMAAEEGQIEPSLHEPIMSGKRRLKDQLLPQLLARMADFPEALGSRYLRIVRIAVAPNARRLGLGSRLLNQIESQMGNQFDAIGASYSRDEKTAAFWRHCGFKTFHEGFRAHPRSGHTTAAVLRTRRPAQANNTKTGTNPTTTTRALSRASTILDSNTLAADPDAGTASLKDADECGFSDRQLVGRFSEGARSYHDTRAALLHLWMVDADRRDSANLDALDAMVCRDLPPRSSRKKRETAMRAWARNTLTRLTN